jgi:transposase
MASASASGTVMVEDQRLYINIEILGGKRPTEIHSALREVCGEQIVDHHTVSRWATHFHEGHVSINNDPRPGRPKTSTDEQSVKIVVDFLEADYRVACEEISQATKIPPTSVFHISQKRKICA